MAKPRGYPGSGLTAFLLCRQERQQRSLTDGGPQAPAIMRHRLRACMNAHGRLRAGLFALMPNSFGPDWLRGLPTRPLAFMAYENRTSSIRIPSGQPQGAA